MLDQMEEGPSSIMMSGYAVLLRNHKFIVNRGLIVVPFNSCVVRLTLSSNSSKPSRTYCNLVRNGKRERGLGYEAFEAQGLELCAFMVGRKAPRDMVGRRGWFRSSSHPPTCLKVESKGIVVGYRGNMAL